MNFKIAIIGRTNVGKSTLFNRLVGKKIAIVHDMPGVTRDRREAEAELYRMPFNVIDTAGLEDAEEGSLAYSMWKQTQVAIDEADLSIMMVDGRAGITPLDKHFAEIIRKSERPVVLVANKCEGNAGDEGFYEAYGLGLGDPVAISAEHGLGLIDLYNAILPHKEEFDRKIEAAKEQAEYEAKLQAQDDDIEEDFEDDEYYDEEEEVSEGQSATNSSPAKINKADREDDVIHLAIVGRPNVGKSTLLNALIGEDRMLTGPEAGVTRDAIAVDWSWKGKKIKLVDTAGLRRSSRVSESLEKMSAANTKRALNLAQVVVLVLDADAILDKQDLTIAREVIEEGRALMIAVNKWDSAADREESLQRLNDRLETSLTQVAGIPTVTISALKRRNLDKLMDRVTALYNVWNKRISTAKLNRWFEEATSMVPPPSGKRGMRIKLRYITQAKTRPPSFYVFSSNPEGLPESYTRYLTNGLRDVFKLYGVPIRIAYRKNDNPYADRKKRKQY